MNNVRSEEHLDIYRFIQLDPDEIATLEYKTKDSTTKLVPLTKGLAMLITNFQEMYWEIRNTSMDYNDELILSITADEFDEYQNSVHMKCLLAGKYMPTTAPWNPMIHAPDPLAEFRKGIK